MEFRSPYNGLPAFSVLLEEVVEDGTDNDGARRTAYNHCDEAIGGEARVLSCRVSDTGMVIKLTTTPESEITLDTPIPIIQAGNSEVGMRSAWIEGGALAPLDRGHEAGRALRLARVSVRTVLEADIARMKAQRQHSCFASTGTAARTAGAVRAAVL